MTTTVFCSHRDIASCVPDAVQALFEFRPPASRGDIASAVADGAKAIVLLDGEMVTGYSPSPQEVATAARSAVVLGAASLGALRAVELEHEGVLGLGWVFRQFKLRNLASDDELVAVIDGASGRNETIPLVITRYGALNLARNGVISWSSAISLCSKLKNMHFSQRSKDTVLECARASGINVAVSQRLIDPHYDIKRLDAILALQTAAGSRRAPPQSQPDLEGELCEVPLSEGIWDVASRLAVSRVAITTGLDTLGIPTCSCVRPGSSDVIWVYSGKGLTTEAAALGCVMECAERTITGWDRSKLRELSEVDLDLRHEAFIPPAQLAEGVREDYSPADAVDWVLGETVDGVKTWLPAEGVFSGADPRHSRGALKVRTTNGLGAGFSLEHARTQALREVVERHIVSVIEVESSFRPLQTLLAYAAVAGVPLSKIADQFVDDNECTIGIDVSEGPEELRRLADAFERSGLTLYVHLLPDVLPVFAFAAACVERIGCGGLLATAGYGVSFCPAAGALKAVLELAQSRATDLQGSREDCGQAEKARLLRLEAGHWLLRRPRRIKGFKQLSGSTPDTYASYTQMLTSLGYQVCFFDFEFEGLFASRAVVPGLRNWHGTAGECGMWLKEGSP